MYSNCYNLCSQLVVDICITTDWPQLENVCMIADLLARSTNQCFPHHTSLTIVDGMENVVCISYAKVPIVKIWDPLLHLACDMNVNNTLALENTRMIKTYIQIDPRVRPLAMIIKHWTKRRILNDAGKLSLFIVFRYIIKSMYSFWWNFKFLYLDMYDHQLSPDPSHADSTESP